MHNINESKYLAYTDYNGELIKWLRKSKLLSEWFFFCTLKEKLFGKPIVTKSEIMGAGYGKSSAYKHLKKLIGMGWIIELPNQRYILVSYKKVAGRWFNVSLGKSLRRNGIVVKQRAKVVVQSNDLNRAKLALSFQAVKQKLNQINFAKQYKLGLVTKGKKRTCNTASTTSGHELSVRAIIKQTGHLSATTGSNIVSKLCAEKVLRKKTSVTKVCKINEFKHFNSFLAETCFIGKDGFVYSRNTNKLAITGFLI